MGIHLFQFNNKNFIYLPEHKQGFQIEQDEYDILKSNDKEERIRYLTEIEEAVLEIGNTSNEVKDKTMSLFLNVANSCNCACVYCFANQGDYGKSKGVMNVEVAIKSVDTFLKNLPTDFFSRIIFFGGEPLIAFDVIKETCLYISTLHLKNPPNFHLVTNATLLTKEMVDFLGEYNFSVGLSIDGGEEIHNLNRPLRNGENCFKKATNMIPYLREKIQRTHIRGTYYDFDQSLVKIYQDLIELGIPEIHVPPDLLTSRSREEMNLLCDEVNELAVFSIDFFKKNQKFPFGIFINKMRELFTPVPKELISCGSGRFITCVDINGDVFPCHRFSSDSEKKLGNIKDIKRLFYDEEKDKGEKCFTEKCLKCWNRNTCSHGCSYNNTVLSLEDEKNWCIYSKKMTEATIAMLSELEEDEILQVVGNIIR